MSIQKEMIDSIDALLGDYLENHAIESEVKDDEINKSDEVEVEEKEESSEKKVEKANKEYEEKMKEGDEADEEEVEDKEKMEKKKKDKEKKKKEMEKSNMKWSGNVPSEGEYERPASLKTDNADMIPDPDGDLVYKKGKKMKKSEDQEKTSEVKEDGLTKAEREELELYRQKERERKAEKIQKSIQAEKEAQDKRFQSLEGKIEKMGDLLEKVSSAPAYRRLSRSGTEALNKSESDEKLNKVTSVKDFVLAKSHDEAARVMGILFEMLEKGQVQTKHISCFETLGDLTDLHVKREVMGRLQADKS